jgi:hypothetical protein
MASRHTRPRRLLLPILLAAVLAAEITGIAIARSLTPATSANPAPAAAVAGPGATATDATSAVDRRIDVADAARDAVSDLAIHERAVAARTVTRPPTVTPASPARATRASNAASSGSGASSGGAKTTNRTFHGSNHVWIPSLGISKGLQSFPCSRSRPPDAGVYRWGCAGRNNVYLLSHAWSTFRPLHDAYVGGRLRKGMKVIYADGGGQVHTYSVAWWRVVAPTTAASWAWASLSKPGMTLQTCVGSKSQYRLMVRLTRVG